ncbi:L-rhamnose mutarotase [Allomuricauda sp. SCSIO 65647]|uniref:L-rhamnose mutarotase n=1 Tax=Allomuricauda sp. SCSIO 65647 TaxID=2908843 RepID=UPI001F3ECEF1|nr:L-rhamnose mutarotase [Muricauda sp. SCSIO 65647]UJH68787.1 L-rhamnose mutarotase [Muricauda sp. SCSIO 65647]
MKRYCWALDLVNDEEKIEEYEAHHKSVWPEIIKSIRDTGIVGMEIHRIENRLFMIMEVDDTFSFERKRSIDSKNPKVREWETLMWQYQQALPTAKPGEKWLLMKKIFEL